MTSRCPSKAGWHHKGRIGPDIVAGRTPAALVIPEVMAYTKIIGTPVITGLYTLFLPVLVAARKRLETGDLSRRRFGRLHRLEFR